MSVHHQNIEAIQMQIVRLIAGITDEAYLIHLREGLQQNKLATSSEEISSLEKEWVMRSLKDVDKGHLYSNEEIQAQMRAKLQR